MLLIYSSQSLFFLVLICDETSQTASQNNTKELNHGQEHTREGKHQQYLNDMAL